MSKVNLTIGLGLVFIFIGAIWMFTNTGVTMITDMFPINTEGLELMKVGWRVWPTAIIILGIACFITGVSKGGQQEGF